MRSARPGRERWLNDTIGHTVSHYRIVAKLRRRGDVFDDRVALD